MPTFIDNVAVLAVEMCLVEGLEEIFSPSTVSDMGEETLGQLASEPANVQRERSILSETRDRLLTALEICEPHLPLAYLGKFNSYITEQYKDSSRHSHISIIFQQVAIQNPLLDLSAYHWALSMQS